MNVLPEEVEKEKTNKKKFTIPMSDVPGEYDANKLKDLLSKYLDKNLYSARRLKDVVLPALINNKVMTREELKKEFADPLKKLTKTQGMILMKMIEKELDKSMHRIIRELRGGLNATYWSTAAGMFGHKLRKGYEPGLDPVLDAVLNDLDTSYKISRN